MDALSQMKCVACRGDAPPATADDIAAWLPQLPEWKIIEREGVPKYPIPPALARAGGEG